MCYATVDTDAIGSCRLPAACCSVIGFKGTYGLISGEGILAGEPPPEEMIVWLSHPAVSARRVADTAIGLTLPGITRIQPWLVPAAAAGLMIVTISAAIFHLTRGETPAVITTTVLFLVLTFVAYMRWKVLPIAPRTPARATAA